KLAEFTRLLGEAGIDLISLSIADTTNFGILRCIVADYQRAAKLIAEGGYTVRITEVLAAVVPDRPGGLAGVLGILVEAGISIEYLYSFVRHAGHNALLIFRVEALEQAAQVLIAHGVELIAQEQVKEIS
ncbi:MAG: ACT domain-containing protein, partial [Clostridia bacterium]